MQRLEIRIEGHLDRKWIDWLGGFAINKSPMNSRNNILVTPGYLGSVVVKIIIRMSNTWATITP